MQETTPPPRQILPPAAIGCRMEVGVGRCSSASVLGPVTQDEQLATCSTTHPQVADEYPWGKWVA